MAADAAAAARPRWYAFGTELLERLREEAQRRRGGDTDPILWPEHFDVAIELGEEAAGCRATYGFSPGDENHPEPYAYVAPWTAAARGELWNARGFSGAELGLRGAARVRRDPVDFFEALQLPARPARCPGGSAPNQGGRE